MASDTGATGDDDALGGAPARARDADATRRLLLRSARRRFALDGYGSTTVREIAADAGVNVALINRYFDSKEGLFEACLSHAAEDFERPTGLGLEQVVQGIVDRLTAADDAEPPLQLLLLLRSSGDERADRIRHATLRAFAERIAEVVGWRPDAPGADALLLRAEVAMCTTLGMTLLRMSGGLEPLASADRAALVEAVGDVFRALLLPGPGRQDEP